MEWKFLMKRNASCIFLLWDGWRGEYEENERKTMSIHEIAVRPTHCYLFSNHRHRTKKSTTTWWWFCYYHSNFSIFFSSLSSEWLFGCLVACRCHLSVSRHKIVAVRVVGIFARKTSFSVTNHIVAVISFCWMGPNVMLLRIWCSCRRRRASASLIRTVLLVSFYFLFRFYAVFIFFFFVNCLWMTCWWKKYRYVNHFTWFNKCGATIRGCSTQFISEQWHNK